MKIILNSLSLDWFFSSIRDLLSLYASRILRFKRLRSTARLNFFLGTVNATCTVLLLEGVYRYRT